MESNIDIYIGNLVVDMKRNVDRIPAD